MRGEKQIEMFDGIESYQEGLIVTYVVMMISIMVMKSSRNRAVVGTINRYNIAPTHKKMRASTNQTEQSTPRARHFFGNMAHRLATRPGIRPVGDKTNLTPEPYHCYANG